MTMPRESEIAILRSATKQRLAGYVIS